jgi:uncharacterized protein Yka (UPF0111/DUF47 family)
VSDTPRTDAAFRSVIREANDSAEPLNEMVGFSMKLERELNAAQQRIKRLEEAGDEMHRYIFDQTNTRWIICAIQWREAKEAKL